MTTYYFFPKDFWLSTKAGEHSVNEENKASAAQKLKNPESKLKTFWPIVQNWYKRNWFSLDRCEVDEYLAVASSYLNTDKYSKWKLIGSILVT